MSAIYDVFISYAEEDGHWVRGYLIDALEAAGVSYCSEEDFCLGVPWIAEFERSVKQSRRTLLILSPAYMNRKNLEFVELLAQFYGLETGTWPVIPLTLHPVKIPIKLKQLKGLDATQPDSRSQVVKRLCLTLGQEVPGLTPKPECPYPGMVPFAETDRDRFFGREAEVEELLEKLRLSPFVTVIGPSGSGKSSLVYAGLIPQLRLTRRFGSGEWLILSMRPGKTPLTFLKTLLEGDVDNDPQTVASLLQHHQAQQLLLLVDQFEETFTLADGAEKVLFQESILALIDTPSCYLVLTVRADFYSELMQSPLWHKIKRHRVEVVPLGDDGLRQAIRRPAENVDVMVESALVERLVTDAAGEPGVLPFVQETLRFLWEKLERRYLPLTAYQQLVLSRKSYGGMGSEKLTGLQVAMERQADAAIADFSDEQIAIARRIFLRLIQFGQGRADTRRQQRVEALRASGDRDFETTLQHLVSCRLLTLSGGEGESRTADIAHEALISGWSELKNWIAERREAEQTRRQLAAKTAEWVRLEGRGGLLDEVELAEAERWLSNPDAIELGVGEKLQDFVRASRAAIELEKQKEKEAQQREYNLLQERLDQETLAKQNERKARIATQKTFKVTVILLAIVAVIGTLAGWQWRQSERGEIIAKVERAKAEFAQNRDTFDALLIALEAGEQFKRSIWWRNNSDLKAEVMEALVATVFWTKERDRIVGNTILKSVAFSPDGKRLASAGYDNIVRLWNISNRDEEPLELIGHEGPVMAVAFSPDGKMIASVGQDQQLRLWTQAGEPIGSPIKHEAIVDSVEFSPDSQFVATGNRQGKIILCNLNTECTTSPPAHQDAVSGVSFSSEGNFLISVGVDQRIILWEWTRDLKLKPREPILAHDDKIFGVDFNPKYNLFATAGRDGFIKLWKLENEPVKIVSVPGLSLRSRDRERYYSVRFSQDGNQLAGGTYEGSIYIWDRNQDWVEIERLKGHRLIVYSIDFSAQGQIASASKDETIKLWQPTNSFVRVFKGHESSINSVDFSPDGQTFVTASEDSSIKLWSSSGSLLETLQGHTARVNQVVFGLDGNAIASVSGNDLTFRLWKVVNDPSFTKKWKNIETYNINTNDTGDMNIANIDPFSSEFGLWAIGGADGMVRFFPEIVDSFPAHQQQIRSLSFSPETQILATTGDDATIKLWTLKDDQDKLLNTLSKHHGAIYDVSFNTDGTKIATASGDTTARFWNQAGNELQVFEGHEASVNRSKLSPDQQIMATASDDETIKIWNLNGNLLVTLRGHENSVNSIKFNPRDSNQILSGGSDNTAILWNLRDAKDLDALLSKGCNMIDNYIEQNRDSLSLSQRICL